MKRKVACATLVAALACAGVAGAQTQLAPEPTPHPLAAALPEAATTPAPSWLVPGARLTYFSAAAQTRSLGGQPILVPDPNGSWILPDGTRAREDVSAEGSGGAGYAQLDVVAVEPGRVVLQARIYPFVNGGTQGPVVLTFVSSALAHPAASDWWIHPNLLARLAPARQGGMSIQRLAYRYGETTFDALYIGTTLQSGRTSHAFDLGSGILLSHNGSAGFTFDANLFHARPGDATGQLSPTPGSGTNLMMNRFVSFRQKALPWQQQAMPDWVRSLSHLTLGGEAVD